MMNDGDSSSGVNFGELELGGLRLKERAELVDFVVGLIQRGVQTCEINPGLQEYIKAKEWPEQGLATRFGIIQAAKDVLRKAERETAEKQATDAERQAHIPDELQEVSLSEMGNEAVHWLWPGRIAFGKVTVVCGAGDGKTCWSLDVAARVSAGAGWPDEKELSDVSCRLSVEESAVGEQNGRSRCGLALSPDSENPATSVGRSGPGQVLLLNGEDHWGDTIRPRLAAGGANFENITAIAGMHSGSKERTTGGRCFDLARDIPALRKRIEALGNVRLVVIDPLEAYCGAAGGQRSARMRSLVAALSKLADECGVAVVVISSGSKCDLPVKYVWNVDCDVLDPELRWWVPVKFNGGPWPHGLAYRVTGEGIVWEERALSVAGNRVQGTTAKQERGWLLREIAEWLKGYLGQGPRAAKEILEAGWASGWSSYQVKRAKLALGVVCHKEFSANGRWLWELSTDGDRRGAHPAGSRRSLEEENQTDRVLEWLDRAARPNRGGRLDHNSIQKNKEVEGVEESVRGGD